MSSEMIKDLRKKIDEFQREVDELNHFYDLKKMQLHFEKIDILIKEIEEQSISIEDKLDEEEDLTKQKSLISSYRDCKDDL